MHQTHSRNTRRNYRFARNGSNKRRSRSQSQNRSNANGRFHGRPRGGRQGGRKLPTFDPSQFINANPIDTVKETYTPRHRFGDFGFDKKLVYTIHMNNMTVPTPIQDTIIPKILEGKDVVGIAETGTGKTAAFLLPLIQKTLYEYKRQTLILTPTRELAIQIEQELKKLSRGFKIHATVCVGGTHIRPQIQSLKRQNHFVIGTPGRIQDLLDRGNFVPSQVSTVILDEADRMLDMGFINPIRTILETLPEDRETLFFSATMNKTTERLVGDFLKDPVLISVKKKDVADSIKQDVIRYGHHNKLETLERLLKEPSFRKVIIFGAMKHSVEKLSRGLTAKGIAAESIHGNKSHSQRQRALTKFKSGNAQVLVATDVAARGIHVENVSHVINYDLPNTLEDYIHRIGRTGRGDRKGEALTFVPS